MENWMVLGGAALLICLLYPPFLGFMMGIGAIVVLTFIITKMIGG